MINTGSKWQCCSQWLSNRVIAAMLLALLWFWWLSEMSTLKTTGGANWPMKKTVISDSYLRNDGLLFSPIGRHVYSQIQSQLSSGSSRRLQIHKVVVNYYLIYKWRCARYYVKDEQSYIFLWTWSFYLNMLTENIMYFRILNLYEPHPPTNW